MASLTRRPDGRWRARYRDPDGRERARHLDRKADAELWLAIVKVDILLGTYLDPAAGRTTFEQFVKRWRSQQPHRPGTARLCERTLQHLVAHPPNCEGLVLSGVNEEPFARAWLHRAWRTVITASGLPETAIWHLLRHTYTSILIDGGESVTVVARRLGHANPSETLRTYSHRWPNSDDRTRQVVDAAFFQRPAASGVR